MKKTSFLKVAALLLSLFAGNAYSATYVVWNTKIGFYAQSITYGSTAHLIQASAPIYSGGAHPWCVNRAYIDINDKELLSMAMAASISNQIVHFIYDDAAPEKAAFGHIASKCRVVSIFN